MSLPKVLVAVATYDTKLYIQDRFLKCLQEFSYPNYDVMIVDNSVTKKNTNTLKKLTKRLPNFSVSHVNRGDTSREAQTKSLNKMRDVFLKGDYDYFLTVESDLLPPRDIIERYIAHNVPVVGSMYLIGYADSEKQAPRPCLFGVKPDGKGGTFNYPPEQGFAFFGNGLMKIHGCGFGVTLMKRRVMEKIKFWYDLNPPVKHADVLFYMDLHNSKMEAFVDTDMFIPHYNSKWDDVKDK